MVAKIRSEGKNTKSPIIYMHQAGEELAAQKAVESGASATLKRPVEERALRELTESLLDKYILIVSKGEERDQENQSATMSEVERGQRLLERGDLEGAEAAFEGAMMTGGGSSDVFCGLAEVYLARGDKEAAEQVLGEAVRIDPAAREKFDGRNLALLHKGQELLSEGKLNEAEDTFNKALVKGGEFCEVYVGLSEVHLRKIDREAAEQVIAEAEKLDPGVRDRIKRLESTLVSQGNERYQKGELDGAKGAYECAVVANDKSVAGNVGLGQTLQAMGDKEGSEKAFQKALESEERPEDLHIYNKMGITARKSKDFETALSSYDRALSFDSGDPVLHCNKAMVYVAQSQFEECLKWLDKALELDSEFAEAAGARKKIQSLLVK
ncbi:MAG TPA: hypothetical protein DDZ83_09245 [Nitrospinae bacterium]|nr:hypothetical protein [Nitrospinota bacterium]